MTNSTTPINKLFRQRAAGTFSPTIVAGTPHCGINDTQGNFRYDVEIVYRGGTEILDASGFLLDNLTFQHYFASLANVTVSCEMLASQACDHFLAACGDRASCVKSICVKVYPFGEVFVEATVEQADMRVGA